MPPTFKMVAADATTAVAEELIPHGDLWKMVVFLVSRGSELAIIFGVIPPFVPQYLKLKQTGNVEGFSLYVCFTLILASILRILFWVLKRFETPLLIQSFVMITTMLFLVHAYVSAKKKAPGAHERVHEDSQYPLFNRELFWHWNDYSTYLYCVISIATGLSLITAVFQFSAFYTEAIGFFAVFAEACLGLPQFIRNLKNRSTAGMSVIMVLMWTSGDTFKFFYFLMRAAPLQFSICAMLQILLDIGILGQVVYYSSLSKPISKNLPAHFSTLRHTVE